MGAHMRTSFWLAAIVVALVTPIAQAAPYQDPNPCAKECEVEKFLNQNIGIPLDRPVTLAELRHLAHVDSETTSKAGVTGLSDTMHIFRYPGLEVRAELTAENTVLVQKIDLTAGPYRMPFNIKLGKIDTAHDIDYVLGQPSQTRHDAGQPTKWIYRNLEGTAILTFDRSDNEILAVHWDFTPAD